MPKTYSIIIPTLNQSSKLEKCLTHLAELNFDTSLFEVLVIDNGSTDNTKKVSLSFAQGIENLNYRFCADPGLMAARHMGCDEAGNDILCYIDDDSFVDKDWLQGIDEAFSDENVALVGGPCIPEYEVTPPYWMEFFWSTTRYGRVNGFLSLIDFGDKKAFIHPKYVWGCNFSVRKEIFLELGGTYPDYFPEHFKQFIGPGEAGLSLKIYASGLKAMYAPLAKIHHFMPESRLNIDYFCWKRYYNGIHDSYRAIRRAHGLDAEDTINPKLVSQEVSFVRKIVGSLKRRLKSYKNAIIQPEPIEVRKIREKIRISFEEGFRFHQQAVKKDPKLLEWILRENYFGENGKLPKL